MLFDSVTIRLLGRDDFPVEAKHAAATDLTVAAREGALSVPVIELLPLEAVARAHDMVDAGSGSRVLLTLGTLGGGRRLIVRGVKRLFVDVTTPEQLDVAADAAEAVLAQLASESPAA